MAATLFEFYTQKGQALPPLTERAKLFEQQGLGSAITYQGTAEQNTALLGKLQTAPLPAPVPGIVTVGPTPVAPTAPTTQVSPELEAKFGQIKTGWEDLLARIQTEGITPTPTQKPTPLVEEKPPTAFPTPPEAPPEKTADDILKERIAKLEELAFTRPKTTWEETYQMAYKQAGLGDLKKQVDDFNNEISSVKEEFGGKKAEIEENPWLSQSGIEARTSKLQEQYQRKLDSIVAKRDLLWDYYKTGIGQAENIATRMAAETEAGKKLDQEELKYWIGKLEETRKIPETPKTFTTPEGTWQWNWTEEFGWKPQLIVPSAPKAEEGWTEPYTLATGEIVQKNKTTGQIRIVSKPTVATGAATSQQFKNLKTYITGAQASLEQLKKKMETIDFPKNLAERYTKGVANKLKAATQADSNLARFNAIKNGIVSLMARARGEVGVLTEQDIQRVKDSMPNLDDTQDVAMGKLADINLIFNEFLQKAGGEQPTTGTSVILRDSKTGELREFNNLSPEDIVDAINQGFELQ